MPPVRAGTDVEVYPSAADLADAAAARFVSLAAGAIAARGRFAVALAGGNTPRPLYDRLAGGRHADRVDWSRVHLFWGDERVVPPDHPDSNFGMAHEALLRHVPVPAENVHRIHTQRGPEAAAADYEARLTTFFGPLGATSERSPDRRTTFDLVLLGLGEDGHTASLFPGSAALEDAARRVAAVYLPESGMWRVTLTPRAINEAAEVLFLITGASKADILGQVLRGPPDPARYPAQAIRPAVGRLRWWADRDAASFVDHRQSLPERDAPLRNEGHHDEAE